MLPTLLTQAQQALAEGKPFEATGAFEQILQTSTNDPHLAAVTFYNLGQYFQESSQAETAIVAYEEGIRSLKKLAPEKIDTLIQHLRNIPKSFNTHTKPLPDLFHPTLDQDLEQAKQDPLLLIKLILCAGNGYLSISQPGPALNFYQQALDQLKQITEHPSAQTDELRAHLLTHIGLLDKAQARAALQEALNLLTHNPQPRDERRALAAWAGLLWEEGKAGEAIETYQRALALYAQSQETKGEGRVWAALGHLHQQKGDAAQAEAAFAKAVELADQASDEDTLWHALWGLGRFQRQRGDLEKAAASLNRALPLIEQRADNLRTDEGKVSFLESVQGAYDEVLSLHLGRKSFAEALNLLDTLHGKVLYQLMGGHNQRQPKQITPQMLPTRMAPSTQIPSKLAEGIEVAQTAPATPIDIRQTAPAFPIANEPSFVVDAPQQPSTPPPPPLPRLIFHVLDDCTVVILSLPGGKVEGHVAAIGKEPLIQEVNRLRAALGVHSPRGMRLRDAMPEGGGEGGSLEPLSTLYDLLIAPLQQHIPAGTLAVEPHGPLWSLPFAALQPAQDRWWVDQAELLLSPSIQVLQETRGNRTQPGSLKALIVGNPKLPELAGVELQQLPAAETEAKELAKLLKKPTLLLGSKPTLERIKKELPHHNLIHLATHGLADSENPLESFLVLSGGTFSAREALRHSIPATLVTLSACQTGLGKVMGDGMIGLARSFLVAGADSVLVSLWSVSDEATRELMLAFYREYLGHGNKSLALQRAMQSVKAIPEFAHPRFWAGFGLVGSEM